MEKEYISRAGVECPVCGISSLTHSHPPLSKPRDFIIIPESAVEKAVKEGACLQRIEMRVFEFMKLPPLERNSIEMANDIFKDVEKVVKQNN